MTSETTRDVTEGEVDAPGGRLRYRVAGSATAPLVVFESAWGASFPHLVYLERELAGDLRLLTYDRAGVGESTTTRAQTPAGITEDLRAVLGHLGESGPVVVAGHSLGGLIAALHAAQAPGLVRAVAQVDPTPELHDAYLDKRFRLVPHLAAISLWFLRRGRRDPFAPTGRGLPDEVRARVLASSHTVASLSASKREVELLEPIRAAAAAVPESRLLPRLVVSAGVIEPPRPGWTRILADPRSARETLRRTRALHEQQVAASADGTWESVPYPHAGMVTEPAGAAAVAGVLLPWLRAHAGVR